MGRKRKQPTADADPSVEQPAENAAKVVVKNPIVAFKQPLLGVRVHMTPRTEQERDLTPSQFNLLVQKRTKMIQFFHIIEENRNLVKGRRLYA